jgi:hypothetical protein
MVQDIIEEIKNEIATERETVVKRAIEEHLKNFVFDEKNISPTLIALLMAQSGGSGATSVRIPPMKPAKLPETAAATAKGVLDFININVTAIVNDLLVGNNVYLYGRAGTGKTSLANKIADEILLKKSYVINCNQFTSPVEIRGGQTIEGYKDGNLTKAWEEGSMLILDELPKLDPNTAGLLNEALAKSADRPKNLEVTEDEYIKLSLELDAAEADEEYLGYSVKKEDDKFYKVIEVTITDGKGQKRKKGDGFCVIATGNTDMKTPSPTYGGNNKQDYSLVDRFAGSYYEIDYDVPLEKKLTYDMVFQVSMVLRDFLNTKSVEEFISLRTMLNFNRIYEQEMLRKIGSPFAVEVISITRTDQDGDEVTYIGKTFAQSVNSFIEGLPPQAQNDLRNTTDIDRMLVMDTVPEQFIQEFIRLYGTNPINKEKV